MKQYVTHGTGSAQTLSEVQNTNVVVYDTKADAEADLSNLSEGQIVATKDSGDELAQPVDTIASGNMHAVTSNAVANSNAMPVDQVALNNLHSVTSNAVAQAFNAISDTTIVVTKHNDYMYLYKFGKVVFMSLNGDWTELDADWNLNLATIPQGYRPIQTIKFKETTVDINATMYVYPTGEINVYNYDSAFNYLKNGQYYGCWITGE